METQPANPESMYQFIDFYAILEIDITADPKDIESQFFELGQRLHPNVPVTGDEEKFELLTQAFQMLRIPESREAYDQIYMEQSGEMSAGGANNALDDSDAYLKNIDLEKEARDRVALMKKFYETRRVDMRNPGLASGGLTDVIDSSTTMLEFHMWYCLQKGWLFREEGGLLSITADGVDHVERGIENEG